MLSTAKERSAKVYCLPSEDLKFARVKMTLWDVGNDNHMR
jgi:hypothetical protein